MSSKIIEICPLNCKVRRICCIHLATIYRKSTHQHFQICNEKKNTHTEYKLFKTSPLNVVSRRLVWLLTINTRSITENQISYVGQRKNWNKPKKGANLLLNKHNSYCVLAVQKTARVNATTTTSIRLRNEIVENGRRSVVLERANAFAIVGTLLLHIYHENIC